MTSTNEPLGQADRTEGDINLSDRRLAWQQANVNDATRETLERDSAAFLHQSLSSPCLTELTGCDGVYLTDAAGRRIMDFHGNSAHQVGHAHPRVIEAIKRQLDDLAFCPRRFTNQPAIALAERLGKLAPGNLAKVLFAPGGTAAIGIAMKLARYATGRHKTISMHDSFHGASLDAISIGGRRCFATGLARCCPAVFTSLGQARRRTTMPSRKSSSMRATSVPSSPSRCAAPRSTGRRTRIGAACESCATGTARCWSSTKSRWRWAAPAGCFAASTAA
jgi:4-aminobutyrate aminotransferase-like enzyme